jgi:hypothetical protein
MADADPDAAAERIRKLIVIGDNRLKQGGGERYAKARETFEQAQRLAGEAGLGERFRPFIERRLRTIDDLSSG